MERIENIFSKIDNLTQELKSYIEKLKKSNENLWHEVENASNAYFDDVAVRKNKIKAQIEILEMQKNDIVANLASFRPSLVEATIAGDEQKLNDIQSKMAELQAQEAAINTQIEFLYETPITGSNTLFDIAKELNDKLEESGRQVYNVCHKIEELAKEQIKVWKKIESDTETLWCSPWGAIERNRGKESKEFKKITEYHCGMGESIERHKESDCSEKPRIEGPKI